jgi:hypothetical protein
MKCAVEIASGSMIYVPNFVIFCSGVQKLGGINLQTHRQQGDPISLLLFFQNKGSGLKPFNVLFDLRFLQFYNHNIVHFL